MGYGIFKWWRWKKEGREALFLDGGVSKIIKTGGTSEVKGLMPRCFVLLYHHVRIEKSYVGKCKMCCSLQISLLLLAAQA